MIEARKSIIFEKMFSLYHRQLLAYSFERIYWHQTKTLPGIPAVYIANHSCWWDGLIFYLLNRTVLPKEAYIMMHESGLKQYPYFKWLGAFSINRENPKDILKSLQYAEGLLQQKKSVWIFPQGDEFHLESRPLYFQTGVLYLLEKCPHIPIVPISFYYSFGQKRKPEVYIAAGNHTFHTDLTGNSRKEKTAALEQICTYQLDELKKLVINKQLETFSILSQR
ncbi:lysophospholipid acyltransferase family protein [Metabacillus fastidiosus]|uniref:lysophospholipid acyltransferase family protein n=1 Tax=Metabacillus fastidiosus TaxID=1458 RepID=UPI003D29E62F